MNNGTTWESTKAENIDYMKVYPAGHNPFNQGLVQNLLGNCCHGNELKEWELPDIDDAWKVRENRGFSLLHNQYYDCC